MRNSSPTPRFKSRKAALSLPAIELPTAERRGQDEVMLVRERDPEGWQVAHYRATDVVARLIRAGLADAPCAGAADRFRRDFVMARLDPLAAIDLARPIGSGRAEQVVDRTEDAKYRLWRALEHLGGMNSPTGSVLWFVVGGEMSLREWTLRQVWGGGKTLRHDVATGILIGALAALTAYYDDTRRGR